MATIQERPLLARVRYSHSVRGPKVGLWKDLISLCSGKDGQWSGIGYTFLNKTKEDFSP